MQQARLGPDAGGLGSAFAPFFVFGAIESMLKGCGVTENETNVE